jgi:hypothetical protein
VVECLPSKFKALSSNPRTTKKKKKRKSINKNDMLTEPGRTPQGFVQDFFILKLQVLLLDTRIFKEKIQMKK